MEGFDEFVIVVNVFNIVQLLKYKMAWVIKYIYSFMIASSFEKPFKGDPIVKVFTRMYFVTNVNTIFIKGIENG